MTERDSGRTSIAAVGRWLDLLTHGGVIAGERTTAVPLSPIPRDRLAELEAWLAAQPAEVRQRERRAAIEICIWMANADRELDASEAALLKQLIDQSGLDDDTKDALVADVHEPPSLADVEERLTHPVLRELLVWLAWELAHADGRVARMEEAFLVGLAKRLQISPERLAELKAG